MIGFRFKIRAAITSSVITYEDNLRAAVHRRRGVVAVATFVHQLQNAIIVRQLLASNSGTVLSIAAKYHAQ